MRKENAMDTQTVTLKINDRPVTVPKGSTLLQAAREAGVRIPTLCHVEGLSPSGACRICVVEVTGTGRLLPACAYPAEAGMAIDTRSAAVRRARKTVVELLLANHRQDCLYCVKNLQCELQALAAECGVREKRYSGRMRTYHQDLSSPALERDPEKCILCGRCVRVCEEIQQVGAIDFTRRGFDTMVLPAFNRDLSLATCTYCGQCILECPTGALREKSHLKPVWNALNDPDMFVVAQVAPAIRVSLGEEFGLSAGSVVTGKIPAALHRLGVTRVFDTNLAADLTILEEATELIHRLQHGGPLPLLTSCSPGWVKYIEHFQPGLLPNVSTCKSPHMMLGALVKTYFARKEGLDPAKIFVVSIMPCTAKKYEAQRPEMASAEGWRDVDAVLTTRELARMIRGAGIDFHRLGEVPFDEPLGLATGAGDIFGASGGVMEAALRSAHFLLTGREDTRVEFEQVRGPAGFKEATVDMAGTALKVAAVSGLKNAAAVLERIGAGESPYHFIEIMCCPGGCINGGGQPLPRSREILQARANAIYEIDREKPMRRSHHNPGVKRLYEEFLGQPHSAEAHRLLHTRYTPRAKH
jgi:iron-only hydrogenase group A